MALKIEKTSDFNFIMRNLLAGGNVDYKTFNTAMVCCTKIVLVRCKTHST